MDGFLNRAELSVQNLDIFDKMPNLAFKIGIYNFSQQESSSRESYQGKEYVSSSVALNSALEHA